MTSHISDLERIDPKTVPKVPFHNQIIYAKIEEVYDGDTVKEKKGMDAH
jgi:hypothetical protein